MNVILETVSEDTTQVVKIIANKNNISKKEAAKLLVGLPNYVAFDLKKEEAYDMVSRLSREGATAKVEEV